ncbi:hypothetical protein HY572_05220 [Candidatus Micrarchaeota archaeon]|nr:hypothetical protein [Candidatus Micrarchaeota archaeon]
MKYSDAGVNVEAGDQASKAFYAAAKRTWKNRVQTGFDDFSGLRYVQPPVGCVMGENVDGVGTKTEVAERLGKFDTLGFDLLAMVCDDAVVRGGEPFYVTNVLDVNQIQSKPLLQLAQGLEAAAIEAGVAVVNGEIAELGTKVGGFGSFCLNWTSSCTWFAKKERLISGKAVKAGHAIVALKEDSFRSNGLSLARKIMEKHFGKNWHEEDRKLAEQILSPSKLYTRFAVSLFGGVDGQPAAHVSAMAHVTGGGIPGKLGRALKPSGGLGAELSDLFEPCNAMKTLIEMGGVAESEAYKAWNMGNGFLVVTDEPDAVLKQAKKFKLEAKTVGHVTKTPAVHINGKE